ncbi:shikimate dehydrogenase [Bosea sp. (in: a-proteobacteria)]|uniref:shikimate dehydrogenase family protein n=1 Tax=Bosea sp. (in: a-proteobacteria) TaxID=1871050 RepID=UPI002734736B|nr:shikimate dehydrogenase [Bosea sp. (in: a-proteobacteria)]MDP3256251.1 shikimate dehydrogenase [Bosea sp. (in: a-proteobacteria)]
MTPPAAAIPITGATRLIGFLGDPVIHARSPQNFNPRLAAAGHDAVLVPIHLPRDEFDAAIGGIMAIANLDGLVVTMPFKERLIARLDEVSARARAVGAVNAARRRADGAWVGDIFDGVGLIGAVESLGISPRGLSVGLVGAGGAGAAIAFALAEAGVAALAIRDRDGERAADLCRRVAAVGPLVPVPGAFDVGAIDLLVHATPVGMAQSDGIAIDITDLSARTAVVDIVTKPSTPLLRAVAERGCRHAGGGTMVAAQTVAILSYLGFDTAGGVADGLRSG